MPQKPKPLDGFRVLDLSRVLAGPFCGQMLADVGADVVKVESPRGDENRKWSPITPRGESCNFLSVNRGKRGMTLNLQSERGRALLQELVAKADVLIHNFLPSTMRKLGFDIDGMLQKHPRLVICSISAYGAQGPMKDAPGYDGILQAFSGIMDITGEPDGGPVRSGASVVDMSAGLVAFGGIMSALIGRHRDGADRHVMVSLLETAVSLLGFHAVGWLEGQVKPRREGSGLWHLAPYQAFKCSDAYIMAGALTDDAWRRLCDAMELPELRDDPKLATKIERAKYRDEFLPILKSRFQTRTATEWLAILAGAGVPCSPIHTVDQVMTHPQVLANNMHIRATRGDGSITNLVGAPFKIGPDFGPSDRAPPGLGEHTDQILSDWLDLSASDIGKLRSSEAL